MNQKNLFGLNFDCFKTMKKTVAEESDRGKIIFVASLIDTFLKIKLKNEFSKGNAKARRRLFNLNGPFASISAKLNTVFCAGWIDEDVYHDVKIITKLRNDCAHTTEPITLNDENIRTVLESFRVPQRQFDDWGELKVASIDNGIVFYTGEKPEEAEEDLYIGELTFNMALSLIFVVLIANLEIPFTIDEKEIFKLTLPEHLEITQESGKECR